MHRDVLGSVCGAGEAVGEAVDHDERLRSSHSQNSSTPFRSQMPAPTPATNTVIFNSEMAAMAQLPAKRAMHTTILPITAPPMNR